MEENFKKEILNRLRRLEGAVFGPTSISGTDKPRPVGAKQITLPEIARGKNFKNGQQKVTAIIGYYEQIKGSGPVEESGIREGWRDGKFSNTYANILLQRAIKDGLVRDLKDGTYDLSQSGEDLFKEILSLKK